MRSLGRAGRRRGRHDPGARVKYRSTRSDPREVSLSEAMREGLAPDGGLYVPAGLPRAQ
ncbi:MAG: hypothetical protein AB7P44_05410, partial [Steroidobacteraceae bacterium]